MLEPTETPATPKTEEKPPKSKSFMLWEYTTVGDEDIGFTVTDREEVCTITIEEPITPWAINQALAEEGIWEQTTLNCLINVKQQGEDYLLEDEIDGRPIGKMVPVTTEPKPDKAVWDHIIDGAGIREEQKEKAEKEKPLVNNECPKCGGTVTGEQVEFISADRLTQDVTCDECGYIFRHYYKLYDVEEI